MLVYAGLCICVLVYCFKATVYITCGIKMSKNVRHIMYILLSCVFVLFQMFQTVLKHKEIQNIFSVAVCFLLAVST